MDGGAVRDQLGGTDLFGIGKLKHGQVVHFSSGASR